MNEDMGRWQKTRRRLEVLSGDLVCLSNKSENGKRKRLRCEGKKITKGHVPPYVRGGEGLKKRRKRCLATGRAGGRGITEKKEYLSIFCSALRGWGRFMLRGGKARGTVKGKGFPNRQQDCHMLRGPFLKYGLSPKSVCTRNH